MVHKDNDYILGQHDSRLEALEHRCNTKEAEIKVLNAFKNRAVAYVTVLVAIANKLLDNLEGLLS